MSENMRTNSNRSIRVCVDSYINGVPVGRIFHPSLEKDATFSSIMQLIVSMEQIMDKEKAPQSFTAKRSFTPMSALVAAPVSSGKSEFGEKGTFAVKVLFRQHASWQGTVTWVEGESEETFRSVLELVMLMDSALGGCYQE